MGGGWAKLGGGTLIFGGGTLIFGGGTLIFGGGTVIGGRTDGGGTVGTAPVGSGGGGVVIGPCPSGGRTASDMPRTHRRRAPVRPQELKRRRVSPLLVVLHQRIHHALDLVRRKGCVRKKKNVHA